MLQKAIEMKLIENFSPVYFNIKNESYMHKVPPNSESHFKIIVVSELFENKKLVARHRLINQTLAKELKGQLHALSMHTYTEAEWLEREGKVIESPKCAGKN